MKFFGQKESLQKIILKGLEYFMDSETKSEIEYKNCYFTETIA